LPFIARWRAAHSVGRPTSQVKTPSSVAWSLMAFAISLLPLLEENRDRRHLDQATEHYRKARKRLDELAIGKPGKRPIHPQHTGTELQNPNFAAMAEAVGPAWDPA
jgi:hypothetical protein